MFLAMVVGGSVAALAINSANDQVQQQQQQSTKNAAEVQKKEDARFAMTTGQYGTEADIIQVKNLAQCYEEDTDLYGVKCLFLHMPSGGKFRSYDLEFAKTLQRCKGR